MRGAISDGRPYRDRHLRRSSSKQKIAFWVWLANRNLSAAAQWYICSVRNLILIIVALLLSGVASIRRAGRSRLEHLRRQNLECWPSTSVATVSREAQTSPTL